MTLRHLVLVAALSAAFPAAADDINDQILSTLSPAATPAEPALSIEENTYTDMTDLLEADLWKRIRKGFGIEGLKSDLVRQHENWYANSPEHLRRLFERSGKYLYFVVEEVEKRGIPTEIALLPMIESAYNPKAYSKARASGIWQFIPATGTRYGLEQTWWYDGRRDIFAATHAALDYLSTLYGMFGDWQLALAAYNWGEGAVSRAIARNQAKGLPTDYESLRMPKETRNYVPKLIALRNLIAAPEQYGLNLPHLENKPYFTVVSPTRHMDLEVAARLADMSVDEFLSLNPAYNQPVIAYKAARKILVPVDKAELFTDRLANMSDGLLSWEAYQVQRGETLGDLAERFTSDPDELRRINRMTGKRLQPGQLVLVPRRSAATQLADATVKATPSPDRSNQIVLASAESSSSIAGSPQPLTAVAQTVKLAATEVDAVAETAAATSTPKQDAPVLLVAQAQTVPTTEQAASLAAAVKSDRPIESQALAAPVDLVKLAETEPPSVAPDVDEEDSAESAKPMQHRVVAGDSLFAIARKYGLSIDALKRINNLHGERLRIGTPLLLADAGADRPAISQRGTGAKLKDGAATSTKRYKVKPGDTAYSIARRFSVDIDELLRWNGLKTSSILRPGDKVIVNLAQN